jgi:predicted RNA-binding protein YlxR (DUF448 family)
VKTEEGVQVDETGKVRGRGLNIKPDIAVLEEGFKRKVIERGLKVQMSTQQKEQLRDEFEKVVKGRSGQKQVIRISSEKLSKLIEK